MKPVKNLFLMIGVIALVSSCATSVPVKVMKPAEINMAGYRDIAIMDIQDANSSEWNPLVSVVSWLLGNRTFSRQEEMAVESLERSFYATLIDTDYFTIYSPHELETGQLDKNGEPLSSNYFYENYGITAFIVPELERFNIYLDEEWIESNEYINEEEMRDEYREEERGYYLYSKEMYLDFSYQIIDTRTGEVIALRHFSETDSDQQEEEYLLRTDRDMIEDLVGRIMSPIPRQLAPYEVTERRYLARDRSDSADFEQAEELVTEHQYEKAFAIFEPLYRNEGNISAGINASICLELLGNIDGGIAYLEDMLNRDFDDDIEDELERMEETRAETKLATAQQR